MLTVINGTDIAMHRLLLPDKDGYCVDHINMNCMDNRRGNLRYTTKIINSLNTKIYVTNTSGYRGIQYSSNTWRVRVKVNGKEIHLGSYTKLEQAIEARKEAELLYYGELSPQYREMETLSATE